MKKPTILSLLCLPLLTLSITAASVDDAQITEFQAGDPACAADINDTIQALITAIDDNAARIAELEYISPLNLEDEISNSKFKIVSFETGIGNTFNNYDGRVSQATFGEITTWVLNDDGTVSSTYDFAERETGIDVGHIVTPDPDDADILNVVVLDGIDDSGSDTDAGTWSLNGQILTVNMDGDTDDYFISADGNMLLSGGPDTETSGGVNLTMVDIVVGIRILEPNIIVTLEGGDPDSEEITSDETHYTSGTSDWTYTIHNTGNTNLVVSIGGNINITTPLPSNTLRKGESANFEIEVELPTPGSRTLTITSNDPDSPTFSRTFHHPLPPID